MNDRDPNAEAALRDYRRDQRRRFLKQAGAALGLCASAGYSALAPARWPFSLRDPDGERGKPARSTLSLPSGGFVVPPSKSAAGVCSPK